MIDGMPACMVCRSSIGSCKDIDLGHVCGDCKGILIILEFDLKQIADDIGIQFCADAKIKHRTINARHIT